MASHSSSFLHPIALVVEILTFLVNSQIKHSLLVDRELQSSFEGVHLTDRVALSLVELYNRSDSAFIGGGVQHRCLYSLLLTCFVILLSFDLHFQVLKESLRGVDLEILINPPVSRFVSKFLARNQTIASDTSLPGNGILNPLRFGSPICFIFFNLFCC